MAPLPTADQRHAWLKYQIEEHNERIRHSYEQRLETKWSRLVNWVYVIDFKRLNPEIRQDLAVRLRMVYSGEEQQVFVSHAWRRLFRIRAPLLGGVRMRMTWRQFILALVLHIEKEMAEARFGAYWDGSDRLIPDKGDLRDFWMEISSDRNFLGPAPSYVLIRDPMRRLCHRMIAYSISCRGHAPVKVTGVDLFCLHNMDRGTTNVPHLLAQYLFRHVEERKSWTGYQEGTLLGVWLCILGFCTRYGDTWAWVAQGPKRQQTTTASSHKADKAGQAAEEWIKRIKEEVHDLWRDVVGLRGVIESFTTEQSRVSTWLITCKTQLIDASGETYQPFDNTLLGSSWLSFQRHVRLRTGDASTSAAPYTDTQPDP
ncbi:hypothetical protein Tco_1422447 [Tanacetum coccineum]